MVSKRILIIGSQHGDEYSGERLYSHIEHMHPSLLRYVTYIVGNPDARKEERRYIESDMNRSYQIVEDTYERRRAGEILDYINDERFDLVLDMHTTTVDQPPCLILGDINDRNISFLQASSFDHILVMGGLAESALTGKCPQSIAIEIHQTIGEDLLESICWDIERYINNELSDNVKNVYRDIKPLKKTEIADDDAKKLINFEQCERGYYPIMVGERAYQNYTNYIGFKAYKRYKFKV